MPYTFGAATADDIVFTRGFNMGAASTASLVCGWWYPTTLTATRGLWSVGNNYGAEIDTTTSELRLRTDNITDGQWTTTGVGLAVNTWSFLAFFSTQNNTGPAAAWRVWAGTWPNAPIAVTVTQATAPAGNFTGSTTLYIGNKGIGTLAFQGDIADFSYYASIMDVGVFNPFQIATFGAIDATIEEWVYRRYVLPAWLGLGWTRNGPARFRLGLPNTGLGDECGYISLDCNGPVVQRLQESVAASSTSRPPTINGATRSLNGAPRPLAVHSCYMPPRMLGR